jgi:8-oxo-dGTP diphosphatase/2-hydroxy-dATP diphosphatase
VFIVQGDQILLGLKKRGFGKGNWIGIGGKQETEEIIEQTAGREFAEETGTKLNTIQRI